MPRPAPHLLALSIVVAAACAPTKLPTPSPATPAEREAVFLTSHDLFPGRECHAVDEHVPLPNVAEVVDTAAMPEFMRQAGVPADSGYALFAIRYDSLGGPVRARVIEATMADSVVAPLELALASALIPRAQGHRLAARLRVDFTPSPAYRLGRSEYCEPQQVVVKGAPGARSMSASAMNAEYHHVTRLEYRVDVSASGKLLAVTFLTPINTELENDMRNSMMLRQWMPALDDGLPVSAQRVITGRLQSRSLNPRSTITQ